MLDRVMSFKITLNTFRYEYVFSKSKSYVGSSTNIYINLNFKINLAQKLTLGFYYPFAGLKFG
jgi:hypothetical protein